MGILKRTGEKITPDFTEEDFISAIETCLNRTFYFRDKEIQISRISQQDEHELGYDGVLNTIVPFYIQSKRSDFYSPHFNGQILHDRSLVGLSVDKGFFAFELLKKENRYGQHNSLYELSKKAIAAYVAPMFYKESNLTLLKFVQANAIPVQYRNIDIIDFRDDIRGFPFNRVRVFKNTITIPPHRRIDDNNPSHHYSYCRDYGIGFHSEPVNLENSKCVSLFEFLQSIFKLDNSKDTLNILIDKIYHLLPSLFRLKKESRVFKQIIRTSLYRIFIVDEKIKYDLIISKLNIFDKLLILEDILYQYFDIKQFIKFEPKR